MNHINFCLTTVMAIMLCAGNVGAMEPEKQQNRMGTGNQKEDNTQKMMILKEHMKNLGKEQEDVRHQIGEKLVQVSEKVFRCPTKEELEAHRPKSGKRVSYFTMNEIKYMGLYPENEKTGTRYDLYTHVHVIFTKDGVINQIVCGDQRSGYYATIPFYRKNDKNTNDFSRKDVSIDRTLAPPNPDGSIDLKLPLDTEFTVQKR